MKKWLGGLLALVVAIGFGMGWNYMWSKSSRDKGSSDPTSVVAEAEETLTNKKVRFNLTTKGKLLPLGVVSVNLKDGRVTDDDLGTKNYNTLIGKVEKDKDRDYRLLMQYYGLESSLTGDDRDALLKSMLNKTGVRGLIATQLKLSKEYSSLGYTLNDSVFDNNMGKILKVSKLIQVMGA